MFVPIRPQTLCEASCTFIPVIASFILMLALSELVISSPHCRFVNVSTCQRMSESAITRPVSGYLQSCL